MILLIYLAKFIACTALFCVYYFLFLRNKQMHQYNRFYILASIALSIILPFVKIPLAFPGRLADHLLLNAFQGITFGGWEDEIILTAKQGFLYSFLTASHIILFIYLIGLLLAGYPILRSLAYLRAISHKHHSEPIDNFRFYNTDEPGTPFSFFNIVFWNKNIPVDSEKGQHILKHELFHIRQKHSYDIIYMQIVNAVFWFNPFCHFMKAELKVIHEFLADAHASSATDKYDYAALMVMQAMAPKTIFLSNQFFYNQIKRRINMILQNTHTSYGNIRKAMALPVVLMMFCACSLKSKDESMLQSEQQSNVATSDQIFKKVEIESSFPGGAQPWMRYLNKIFRYPQEAQEQEIQGPVLVQFIVEKDGSLKDIHAIQSTHPFKGEEILQKEAVRVITLSGKWEPARQNGQIVRSYKIQPITFKLEAE